MRKRARIRHTGVVSRPTLAQVAAVAGVSVATVSRVLRERGEISPSTRARVRAAAADLGYGGGGPGRPRAGTARLIDLVLGRYDGPYNEEVVVGAREAATRLGYDLVLTAERQDPADDWPARIAARGSGGVVLGLIVPTARQRAILAAAAIPLVLFEPSSESRVPLPSIRTTDRAGGAAAAEHLLARGARRFIVVDGAPSYRWGRARVEGFRAALEDEAPDATVHRVATGWSAAGARRVVRAALDQIAGDGPVGVFACSDEMAAGVYAAVADAGLRIPDDVLVVGFDDVRGARWLRPALTTVRQPIREMAAAAVEVLVRPPSTDEPVTIELPTRLMVRGSTG
ncbi:MAG: transcriptional regulator [Microbacterium sp.]|nr:transcriptional regulator [Microbacterium sp.]